VSTIAAAIREALAIRSQGTPCTDMHFGATVTIICGNEDHA
jgi:hypothetical protein